MKKNLSLLIFLFMSFFMINEVNATFTCNYECDDDNCDELNSKLPLSNFDLMIDPGNKKIDVIDNSGYSNYNYEVTNSLTTEWFASQDPDKCRIIYVCVYVEQCLTFGINQLGVPNTKQYAHYYIYADDGSSASGETPNSGLGCSIIHKECYYAKYDGQNSTLVPSNTAYKCSTFDNGINSIRALYTEIGNASKGTDVSSKYKKVNEEIERLEAYCKGVYASFDYTSDCVRDCTHLEEEISAIKVQNGIDDFHRGVTSCGLSERIADWIIKIVSWVRYIIPVLLIVLSILDFMKAIAADSEDDIKKAASRFIKRLIVSVVIFLLPLLLEFVLGIFGINVNGFCL